MSVKVLIGEKDGVEKTSEEYILQAEDIEFSHQDFSSDNVKDALVEAKGSGGAGIDYERAIFSLGGNVFNEYLEIGQASPSNKTPYIVDGARNRVKISFSNKKTVGNSTLYVRKITSLSPFTYTDIASMSIEGYQTRVSDVETISLAEEDFLTVYIARSSGTKANEVWVKLKMWNV